MFLRCLVVWFGLMLAAIANGFIRESVLLPGLGAAKAHVVSTILLCALILAVSWTAMPWIAPRSVGDALQVGGLWLAMTLAFEFGFGRLVAHKSWAELLADYDVASGRIWPLVLLSTFAAPWLMARMRGLI